MLIYIILLVIVLICYLTEICKKKRNKKIFIILIISILTFISAFRAITVGTDTIQYYTNYKLIGEGSTLTQVLRYEKGFYFLCKYLYKFSTNPQTLIIITSCFIIPIVGKFIYNNSNNVPLSIFLYITLNIYSFHLTGMRQSIAIAISIIAVKYLIKNEKIKFIILILFASLFHSSAKILLFLIIANKIEYKKNSFWKFLFIGLTSFILYSPLFKLFSIFLGKYTSYENSIFGESNYVAALLQSLVYLTLYTFCHFSYFKNNKDNKKTSYIKFLPYAFIVYLLSMRMGIIGRMAPYFVIYFIIEVPQAISNESNPHKRYIYIYLILIFTFIYWFIIGIFRSEWTGVIPYKFFWN